jgi:hypothetical protein
VEFLPLFYFEEDKDWATLKESALVQIISLESFYFDYLAGFDKI